MPASQAIRIQKQRVTGKGYLFRIPVLIRIYSFTKKINMKKFLLILAIGAFVACNDSGSSTSTSTDSSSTETTTPMVDTSTTTVTPDTSNKMMPTDTSTGAR